MTEKASRESYMESVTVGERKPLNNTILLCEYDAQWPLLFSREEKRLRDALGDKALRIEHVGSTSVPGLCAKPIIDMLLVVADSADESAYVPVLEAAGYVLRIREPDWFEHRMFKGPDTDINLHVFSEGASEPQQMLLFRDWLREHEDDRECYANAKRELAQRTWKHVQEYADAKTDVVREIMQRARRKTATGNKLILYIAASLDGYIADQDGGIEFLNETTLEAMGYDSFYAGVQTIIMGNTTYRQLTTELSPDGWPYEGRLCYVYSHTKTGKTEHAEYTALPPQELLADIRKSRPGNIWLMGGGEIVRLFMQDNLVDEYRITVMPTLLGGGLPLFPAGFPKVSLTLEKVNNVAGVLELIYRRRD